MKPQIEQLIDSNSQKANEILKSFLEAYLNPAFGVLPKKEIDLLVFRMLEQLGHINQNSTIYDLVQKLRVSRAKARNLLYDLELRRIDTQELDLEVKQLLRHPIMQKEGDLFLFEVENPLVLDHFRAKIQALGYLSDGSFSPGIVRLSLDAVVALIGSYLSDAEQKSVQQALVRAGAPDKSFKGIVKASLKQLGKKVAQDAGEALAEKAGDFISPLIDAGVDKIVGLFGKVFVKEEE